MAFWDIGSVEKSTLCGGGGMRILTGEGWRGTWILHGRLVGFGQCSPAQSFKSLVNGGLEQVGRAGQRLGPHEFRHGHPSTFVGATELLGPGNNPGPQTLRGLGLVVNIPQPTKGALLTRLAEPTPAFAD